MKRIILLIAFCLSLSAIYAQTIDVIHLKSGFDARGTITNRTEGQITLQSENGRTLTIDMSEIESMEQEQQAFDPRVLIGYWRFFNSNAKRNECFDIQIEENHGFYTAKYKRGIMYNSSDASLASIPDEDYTWYQSSDIVINDNNISFGILCVQSYNHYVGTNREFEGMHVIDDYDFSLSYINGELVGVGTCNKHWRAFGSSRYETVLDAHEKGCAKVIEDSSSGQFNVYFVK